VGFVLRQLTFAAHVFSVESRLVLVLYFTRRHPVGGFSAHSNVSVFASVDFRLAQHSVGVGALLELTATFSVPVLRFQKAE